MFSWQVVAAKSRGVKNYRLGGSSGFIVGDPEDQISFYGTSGGQIFLTLAQEIL